MLTNWVPIDPPVKKKNSSFHRSVNDVVILFSVKGHVSNPEKKRERDPCQHRKYGCRAPHMYSRSENSQQRSNTPTTVDNAHPILLTALLSFMNPT